MSDYLLKFTLRSEATFGSGEGKAGQVDVEVQQDGSGLPYLAGRTLRGLLVEECSGILFAMQHERCIDVLTDSAVFLFGRPGGRLEHQGNLAVSDALLPEDFRSVVKMVVDAGRLLPTEVLESLTAIRVQTAVDPVSGAPLEKSLRSMRVILRDIQFQSKLVFQHPPKKADLALLSACVKALRRAGSGRNRGRGELEKTCLFDLESGVDFTETGMTYFREILEVTA